jgi:hypothetical protein
MISLDAASPRRFLGAQFTACVEPGNPGSKAVADIRPIG